MEKGWVKVYSSDQLFKIHVTIGMLNENDIQAVEINKQDSSYNTVIFGEVELYVAKENVIRAKYLIEKNNL